VPLQEKGVRGVILPPQRVELPRRSSKMMLHRVLVTSGTLLEGALVSGFRTCGGSPCILGE
jgi:hypothetical protein